MGKISLDLLVISTAEEIKIKQETVRDQIISLISSAKANEPQLYHYFREMISRDDCKDLVPTLSEKFSSNQTSMKILALRKELCTSVQKILDEFKETVQDIDPQLPINTSPIYAPLFCRLKQLEHFLFRLS